MARLNDAWPDLNLARRIAQLQPTDLYARSSFRSSGSNFQSRPLGGHTSACRLFLAVIFPGQPTERAYASWPSARRRLARSSAALAFAKPAAYIGIAIEVAGLS